MMETVTEHSKSRAARYLPSSQEHCVTAHSASLEEASLHGAQGEIWVEEAVFQNLQITHVGLQWSLQLSVQPQSFPLPEAQPFQLEGTATEPRCCR